jgi:hypothetical protein
MHPLHEKGDFSGARFHIRALTIAAMPKRQTALYLRAAWCHSRAFRSTSDSLLSTGVELVALITRLTNA